MTTSFQINKSSYFKMMDIETLSTIEPFVEQRDIDKERTQIIVKKYKNDLKKLNNIHMDCPIIILECRRKYSSFLINKSNNRSNQVVIDGQHRLSALIELLKTHTKLSYIKIPLFIHIIDSLEEGRTIQYNLFEQKPVDYYDKIMKTKYIISDMIDKFTIFYQKIIKI